MMDFTTHLCGYVGTQEWPSIQKLPFPSLTQKRHRIGLQRWFSIWRFFSWSLGRSLISTKWWWGYFKCGWTWHFPMIEILPISNLDTDCAEVRFFTLHTSYCGELLKSSESAGSVDYGKEPELFQTGIISHLFDVQLHYSYIIHFLWYDQTIMSPLLK